MAKFLTCLYAFHLPCQEGLMVVIGQEKQYRMCQQGVSVSMKREQLTGHPGEAEAEWQAHVSVECINTCQNGVVVLSNIYEQAVLPKPKFRVRWSSRTQLVWC